MYVSYLLDKDGPMYPGPVRHSGGLNLAAQNFVGAAQYADYGGYHVNLDGAQSPGPAWPAPYAAPLRDDWGAYGQGAPPPAAAAAAAVHGLNGGSPAAAMAYSPADFHHHHHHHHPHAHHHAGPAPHCSAGGMQPLGAAPAAAAVAAASAAPEPLSPGGQRRGLCEWVRKPAQATLGSQVKTRTKDKYRVVYTDHQRLELEKEFHYSRYITIRRKAELASSLGLSERQVKIWFQNRRAKERKINKKKLQQAQPGAAEPLSPAAPPLPGPAAAPPPAGLGPAAPQ
ncbi:homeobox protein CDX-2 [Centrocercus urophasianus]|uniref:homeobox protein CDX-2 n=1 Tax=Centrocercus urophasianus TaxID=9002 RepID=UPI001C64EBAD|nr:homeobox protein CDX-2 [Centrocercus urophasianus]XP_052527403.1 homeobox protein CDX-2 [Tympanuchus pallidicinctus]